MIDREYCVTMAIYNRWMNDKLYALCADLPDAERVRDRRAFFGSIHRTLDHILAVDQMQLEHITTGAPTYLPSPDRHPTFELLRATRATVDARITTWATGVSPEWLAARLPFHAEGASDGTVARGFWITHWFNHQTHHRGQITTLLSQLGLDIGSTDMHAASPSPAAASRAAR